MIQRYVDKSQHEHPRENQENNAENNHANNQACNDVKNRARTWVHIDVRKASRIYNTRHKLRLDDTSVLNRTRQMIT